MIKKQTLFLKNKYPNSFLKRVLKKDFIGKPVIMNNKYSTSHNSIHHLYHLAKFFEVSKLKINEIDRVVEWGGGYGNLAKMFTRLSNKNITYVIIDLPIMSCVHWLYLKTIFDDHHINLINDKRTQIIKGRINLLPLCYIEDLDLKPDLFISTWALSENSEYSQEYVFSKKCFNSSNITLLSIK